MYTIQDTQTKEYYYGYTTLYGYIFKPNKENALQLSKLAASALIHSMGGENLVIIKIAQKN